MIRPVVIVLFVSFCVTFSVLGDILYEKPLYPLTDDDGLTSVVCRSSPSPHYGCAIARLFKDGSLQEEPTDHGDLCLIPINVTTTTTVHVFDRCVVMVNFGANETLMIFVPAEQGAETNTRPVRLSAMPQWLWWPHVSCDTYIRKERRYAPLGNTIGMVGVAVLHFFPLAIVVDIMQCLVPSNRDFLLPWAWKWLVQDLSNYWYGWIEWKRRPDVPSHVKLCGTFYAEQCWLEIN